MSSRTLSPRVGLAANAPAIDQASPPSSITGNGQPRHTPAVLISAPASGHGKTTVVAAFARLLTRQGLRVRVFKYGPDFLDPAWHTIATDAVVHNVDLWMTGEADICQRLHEAAAEADLIIVEGVMGLYDGDPSAAELALKLDMPVMTVIDAGKMAGTFGAIAHGLRTWMPGLRWAGALANRVASPRHASLLADSIRKRPTGISSIPSAEQRAQPAEQTGNTLPSSPSPSGDDGREPADEGQWLGAIRRNEAFGLPSRHLGLIAGSELPDARARLDAAADALVDTELGQLDRPRLARWITRFAPPVPPIPATPRWLAGRRIAIARDEAFSFIYPANLDVLRGLGAELCFFAPLAAEALPECDALWLPGGYPELHAQALSECHALAQQISAHVMADKPVWAECGGMLPLFKHLEFEEKTWPMWAVLPGSIHFQQRLAGLGMQHLEWPVWQSRSASEVNPGKKSGSAEHSDSSDAPDSSGVQQRLQQALAESAAKAGDTGLRGHTFHYSRVESPLVPVARSHRPGETVSPDRGEAVYQYRQLRASYFHAWFASSPARTAALFLPESAWPSVIGGCMDEALQAGDAGGAA